MICEVAVSVANKMYLVPVIAIEAGIILTVVFMILIFAGGGVEHLAVLL